MWSISGQGDVTDMSNPPSDLTHENYPHVMLRVFSLSAAWRKRAQNPASFVLRAEEPGAVRSWGASTSNWDGVKRLDLPSFPKQSMNRTRYLKQWFSRHWPQTLGSEYNGHWETKQDQPHPFNPGERGAGTQLREWDFRQGPEHCLEEEESEMGLWGYLGS